MLHIFSALLQISLPCRVSSHRGATLGAVGHVGIAPHMDDLIYVTDLGREIADGIAEVLGLHRQPLFFIEGKKVTQPSGLQFVGAMVDDHEFPPNSVMIVWLDRCDLNTRGRPRGAAVDSAAKSAHKSCIATLAEEHHHESSAKSRSEIPVNVFPVSFLVIRQKSTKRWDA